MCPVSMQFSNISVTFDTDFLCKHAQIVSQQINYRCMFRTLLLAGKNHFFCMRNVSIDSTLHRMGGYFTVTTDGHKTFGREADESVRNTEGIACIGHHEDVLQTQCGLERTFHSKIGQERIASAKPLLHDVKTSLISVKRFGLEGETLIYCLILIFVYIGS